MIDVNSNSFESIFEPLYAGDIGAEVTVRTSGKVVWQKAVGHIQGPSKNRFPIYSLTKSFIAALIFRLCESRKLALDDTVSRRISYSLPKWTKDLTIRHLLSHRGGVGDYGGMAFYKDALIKTPSTPLPREHVYSTVFDIGPTFRMGESFAYSNIGYAVLRDIVEQIGGSDFSAILEKEIIQPLRLMDTAAISNQNEMDGLIKGYSRLFSTEWADVRPIYHPGWVFHGLIGSTGADVTKFFEAVFAGRVVNKEHLSMIEHPHPLPFSAKHCKPHYGPGFLGDPQSRWGMALGHNGGGPGYSISCYCFPKSQHGIVTICAVVDHDVAPADAEDLVFAAATALNLASSTS